MNYLFVNVIEYKNSTNTLIYLYHIRVEQVDQVHAKHRTQVEKLRGSNRAKVTSLINDKMQQSFKQQSPALR